MRKAIDLTGQRFGRLTVVERAGKNKSGNIEWRCKCDCGNECIVVGSSLRRGVTKSCGCYSRELSTVRCAEQLAGRKPVIDLTGQRFGRLVVVECAGKKKNRYMWRCKCDCGNECVVNGTSLRRGITKSCGCYGREQASKVHLGDLTGQRFGYLTVVERAVNFSNKRVSWLCKCDCGNECVVTGHSLQQGKTKSCGCRTNEMISEKNLDDLTGRRFGHLVVLKRVANAPRRQSLWLCKCDCGNECVVRASLLKQGMTKSCGCIGRSWGERFINEYLAMKGYEFDSQVRYTNLIGVGGGALSYDFAIKHPSYGIFLIEYQGVQHYDKDNKWHTEDGHFERQLEHDSRKRQAAELLGYPLIEVPYTYDTQEKVNQYLDDALVPLFQRPKDEWEYVEQNAE